MSHIHMQQVQALWLKLQSDYNDGKIDVEQSVHGQDALYQLIKTSQGEKYAKMWIEEMYRKLEEAHR